MINKKNNVDIDHNRYIRTFHQEYQQLPAKKQQLDTLLSEHTQITNKCMKDLTDSEITNLHSIKQKITMLQKEIADIKNLNDLSDYYLKTGALLNSYYDSYDTSDKSNELHNIKKSQRADIYEEYLSRTDPHHVSDIKSNKNDEICQNCGVKREIIASDAINVCPNCGDEKQALIESDKPSYHDPPHENTYFAYKRINHFKEQLAHFQAKETTKIPQEIYDIILLELKKEKRNDLSTLTQERVKRYLKKYIHLGYNKYYENINQIICRLNGLQTFTMTPEIEEQLCNMFMKIQEPFEKYCPSERTNFLSYAYVIYKFCQILHYDEYLPYFNLLKSKDKLRQQDDIWKHMCNDLGWKFYSS